MKSNVKQKIQSSFCLGFTNGIYWAEAFGHEMYSKVLDVYGTHKPFLCLGNFKLGGREFVRVFSEFISKMKNRKNIVDPNVFGAEYSENDSGSTAAYKVLLNAYLCDHARKSSQGNTGGLNDIPIYDKPIDEEALIAGGFVIGKYYSLNTIELFNKARDTGYVKKYNEGIIEENLYLDGIPIIKRILDERVQELQNQIEKSDLTDSKRAFFAGKLSALANKGCNFDPSISGCFKLGENYKIQYLK